MVQRLTAVSQHAPVSLASPQEITAQAYGENNHHNNQSNEHAAYVGVHARTNPASLAEVPTFLQNSSMLGACAPSQCGHSSNKFFLVIYQPAPTLSVSNSVFAQLRKSVAILSEYLRCPFGTVSTTSCQWQRQHQCHLFSTFSRLAFSCSGSRLFSNAYRAACARARASCSVTVCCRAGFANEAEPLHR